MPSVTVVDTPAARLPAPPQRTRRLQGRFLLLSLLAGSLVAAAWPPLPLAPLALVGLVPLFYVWQRTGRGRHFFLYNLLAFGLLHVWVLRSGFRVAFASQYQYVAPATMLGYTLLLCLFLQPFYYLNRRWPVWSWLALPLLWVAHEWTLGTWQAGLTLINLRWIPALFPKAVLFARWTTTLGITFVLVTINALVYWAWELRAAPGKQRRVLAGLGGLLLLLAAVNLVTYQTALPAGDEKVRVAVIQPSFALKDIVEMKRAKEHVGRMVAMTRGVKERQPDLIVWHETALAGARIALGQHEQHPLMQQLKKLAGEMGAPLLVGTHLFETYPTRPPGNITAKPTGRGGFYDVYNAAAFIPPDGPIRFYVKNKLVVFIERVPYVDQLAVMRNLHVELGETYGNYNVRSNDGPIEWQGLRIAPVICSESIYPEYVRTTTEGANLMVLLGNDSWAGDAPIVGQMASYTRLMSVENGLPTVRCSNAGISLLSDAAGGVSGVTKFGEETVRIYDVAVEQP
ncbi:MAG: apolipoprotein N-acyltransferase [Catalinimonas sp.]